MPVAVVMVLQDIEGYSNREAVDWFAVDARWMYATCGLDFGYPGFWYTAPMVTLPRLAAWDLRCLPRGDTH